LNIATDRLYCVLQESKTDEEEVSQTQDTESSSEDSDRSFGETDGEDEHWDSFEEFTGAIDVDGDQSPLPEPAHQPHRVRSIVMWMLYFLVVWQYCY